MVVQVFKYRWGDQNLTSQKLGNLTRVVQGKQGREMGALNLTSPTACAPSPGTLDFPKFFTDNDHVRTNNELKHHLTQKFPLCAILQILSSIQLDSSVGEVLLLISSSANIHHVSFLFLLQTGQDGSQLGRTTAGVYESSADDEPLCTL